MERLPAAVVATVLAAAGSLLPPVAEAAVQAVAPLEPRATVRVRALDHKATALLEDGRARSATFRRLYDTLEEGDLNVLVETRPLGVNVPAQTTFLTDSASVRVVRITVGLSGIDDVQLAWLGHELQHAIEIMSARDVFNVQTMAALHWAHGQEGSNDFCTREAQKVRTQIAYELTSSKSQPDLDPVASDALALVRDRFESVPRIYVVDPALMKVRTKQVDPPAYRRYWGEGVDPNVYLNPKSSLYRAAQKGDRAALRSLAALMAHEMAHTGSGDEAEPSRKELEVIDRFLEDPSLSLAERTELLERRRAVLAYGGLGNLPPTDASGSVHPAIEAVRKLLALFVQAPPPIYVVDPVPLKAKTQANTAAFRLWRGGTPDPNVFVNARADLWQRASRGERVATIALSAAIAHEIVHGRTKDEGPATQGEIEILQYFLGHDASLTNEERAILHRAIEAAKRYGGLK